MAGVIKRENNALFKGKLQAMMTRITSATDTATLSAFGKCAWNAYYQQVHHKAGVMILLALNGADPADYSRFAPAWNALINVGVLNPLYDLELAVCGGPNPAPPNPEVCNLHMQVVPLLMSNDAVVRTRVVELVQFLFAEHQAFRDVTVYQLAPLLGTAGSPAGGTWTDLRNNQVLALKSARARFTTELDEWVVSPSIRNNLISSYIAATAAISDLDNVLPLLLSTTSPADVHRIAPVALDREEQLGKLRIVEQAACTDHTQAGQATVCSMHKLVRIFFRAAAEEAGFADLVVPLNGLIDALEVNQDRLGEVDVQAAIQKVITAAGTGDAPFLTNAIDDAILALLPPKITTVPGLANVEEKEEKEEKKKKKGMFGFSLDFSPLYGRTAEKVSSPNLDRVDQSITPPSITTVPVSVLPGKKRTETLESSPLTDGTAGKFDPSSTLPAVDPKTAGLLQAAGSGTHIVSPDKLQQGSTGDQLTTHRGTAGKVIDPIQITVHSNSISPKSAFGLLGGDPVPDSTTKLADVIPSSHGNAGVITPRSDSQVLRSSGPPQAVDTWTVRVSRFAQKKKY